MADLYFATVGKKSSICIHSLCSVLSAVYQTFHCYVTCRLINKSELHQDSINLLNFVQGMFVVYSQHGITCCR